METLLLFGVAAMGAAVLGKSIGDDDPPLDIDGLRAKLATDRGVTRARERVSSAEGEARKYNEQVARILSSSHPDTVKGNIPIRSSLPSRIVEAHRTALGDVLRAERSAFDKHRSEVDVHFERRRQRLLRSWQHFQRDMERLHVEERTVLKLALRGATFRRSAIAEHISPVGWREWQRRTWPPAPTPREVKKFVALEQ